MSRPPIPYAVQMMLAQSAHDDRAVDRIVTECFGNMTKELLEVAHHYDAVDLPFVLATMRLTAQSMTPILSESGRQFMENLVNHTSCVTVDLSGLRRQKDEEEKGETET